MKLIKRSYAGLDSSICALGFENLNVSSLSVILEKMKKDNTFQELISAIPESSFNKTELTESIKIDNLMFSKKLNLNDLLNRKNSASIEDVVIILTEDTSDVVSTSKVETKNDPYNRIKNICLDKKSIVIFYSPADQDADCFIHKDKESVFLQKIESY